MFEIGLVNMPFSTIHLPSIALTQIKYVLKNDLDGRVNPNIYYLNHDFAQFLGIDHYWLIANSLKSTVSGLGDWFFRKVAFPDVPDNTEAYYARHMWRFQPKDEITRLLDEKREGLESFLESLIDKYELDKCSLVGFTSMFAQNMASFAMARKLKERNSKIVTVMGGANCETCMGAVIAKNVEAIDFVFSGPALKTFPKLVKYLFSGKTEKCHEIVGVLSRKRLALEDSGSFDEIGEERDIEEVVPVDYEDFLASIEVKCPSENAKLGLLFETSRGCWWGERSQCRFCGLNGTNMKYRAMKPEKAMKQFEKLFDYAPTVSYFKAVDNIVPREYLTEVFPYLKTPENAKIFYEIKANLKDEQVEVLAKAGVTEIQPGIEALATSTLKLMRKGTTSLQNIRFLKSCQVHGIKADWNLLVGFPGEGEEVYEKYCEDLPSLFHLQPPTGVYPVRFDRFSPYFLLAEEYGLELKPYDFYEMVYPFEEQDLNQLAYFFSDQNYNALHMKLTAKWIRKLEEHVHLWQSQWEQQDKKPKPQVVFEWKGDSRVVYDSRSGTALEHDLGPVGLKILDLLAEPMSLRDMEKKLEDVHGPELEELVALLGARGLIFREKDRCISLVIEYNRVFGSL